MNENERIKVLNGDCLKVMQTMQDNTFSGILCDPPYGLSYMGAKWDYDVPTVEHFAEMLRVTKPGGFAFIFGGSRTFHRMALNMEDAGWILRDTMMWLYASGFPKSLDISKEIDQYFGEERETVGYIKLNGTARGMSASKTTSATDGYEIKNKGQKITKPSHPIAKDFDGYGTGLKPSFEPIIVAMKPMTKTFVKHAIEDGVSGLNLDECRIGEDCDLVAVAESYRQNGNIHTFENPMDENIQRARWATNIIQDGSEELQDILGEHSRAYMCSKPSKEEKEKGLEDFQATKGIDITNRKDDSAGSKNPRAGRRGEEYKNVHPTVKPLDLMAYLATMLKMPNDNSFILDPYCGSGTTLVACKHVGIKAVGIEINEQYAAIATARCGLELNENLAQWRTKKDENQLKLFD